jgi:hypothetical protein
VLHIVPEQVRCHEIFGAESRISALNESIQGQSKVGAESWMFRQFGASRALERPDQRQFNLPIRLIVPTCSMRQLLESKGQSRPKFGCGFCPIGAEGTKSALMPGISLTDLVRGLAVD